MSLSIVLSCYNETPLIFESYERIVSLLSMKNIPYEMIIVDDGSTETHQQALKKYFHDKQNTKLLFSSMNEGRGSAISKGIRVSSKEVVGFIDTDLEISELYLLLLYAEIQRHACDIVIGKRMDASSTTIYHMGRSLMSRIYFYLVHLILELNHLDTETGIKLFKRDRILAILDVAQDKRWFWDTEIIALSLRHKFKIVQTPVVVYRKKDKKSSVRLFRDTFLYLYALLNYKRRAYMLRSVE